LVLKRFLGAHWEKTTRKGGQNPTSTRGPKPTKSLNPPTTQKQKKTKKKQTPKKKKREQKRKKNKTKTTARVRG